ncbi:hypothetical protein BGZ60DRAFT_371764 [Tricladium varicosporioides]|nr:hypothetical protein BGZ60DRAFT_371764 [Hymenoscyphus varicosporioides]
MARRRRRHKNFDVVEEWDRYFGSEDNLENWQRLCRDVGIDDELPSIRQCKKALETVWVNIHDLLRAIRTDTPVRIFETKDDLIEYTRKKGKYFPREKAKEGGPVKALLKHIGSRWGDW